MLPTTPFLWVRSLLSCFEGELTPHRVSSCYTTSLFAVSIHCKMITVSLVTICYHAKISHNLWLYSRTVHFILVTHLFESSYLLISLTYFFLVYILIVNYYHCPITSVIWVPLPCLSPPASPQTSLIHCGLRLIEHTRTPHGPGSLPKLQMLSLIHQTLHSTNAQACAGSV